MSDPAAAPSQPPRLPRLCAAVLAGAFLAAPAGPAAAHPHVWVEAKSEIVFDDGGRATQVRHAWRFDPYYSTYAIAGYDADSNGLLTREELSELADVNAKSLKEFDYFTFLYVGGDERGLGAISDYWLQYDPDTRRLTFYFVLDIAEPVEPEAGELVLDVFDPEYYVAIEMTETEPFALVGAPAACALTVEGPGALDPQSEAALAAIPADQKLPDAYRPLTAGLSNTAKVRCD